MLARTANPRAGIKPVAIVSPDFTNCGIASNTLWITVFPNKNAKNTNIPYGRFKYRNPPSMCILATPLLFPLTA